MSESNVFTALKQFKAKYAWDKSLVTGHTPAPGAATCGEVYANTSMWDFVALAQTRESARESKESF
jgi:hypothetical protein